MTDLNLFDLIPEHVPCPQCTTVWPGNAEWFQQGKPICPLCTPMPSKTRIEKARRAAEKGQALASAATPDPWKDTVRAWLVDYLHSHPLLFVDDVWEMGCPEPATGGRQAIGSIISGLARGSFIAKSGEYRPRTQGNASPAVVWKSLIYQGRKTA